MDSSERALTFVQHMEEHIRNEEFGKKGSEITKGKVGCTICGLDIDQIVKKDNWNLADKSFIPSMDEGVYLHPKDVKTFIQKVKEDIDKLWFDNTKTTEWDEYILDNEVIKEILDKRTGDL